MPKTIAGATNGRLTGKIETLKPWFHNIHLPGGMQTAPGHPLGDFPSFKWEQFCNLIPRNLSGQTALDIGCNAGFYSFELARRGARVLGIDLDPHYLRQAKWLARIFGYSSRVRFRQMQVYDLSRLKGKFDYVIFMGVFYHLRYPMLALDIVSQKVGKMMIFQTFTMPGNEEMTPGDIELDDRRRMLRKGWPRMAFIEKRLADDPTNWWAPNHSCIKAMLRTCGFRITHNPGHEIYIARPDKKLLSVPSGWNRSEYLSAIGMDWTDDLDMKVKKKTV